MRLSRVPDLLEVCRHSMPVLRACFAHACFSCMSGLAHAHACMLSVHLKAALPVLFPTRMHLTTAGGQGRSTTPCLLHCIMLHHQHSCSEGCGKQIVHRVSICSDFCIQQAMRSTCTWTARHAAYAGDSLGRQEDRYSSVCSSSHRLSSRISCNA